MMDHELDRLLVAAQKKFDALTPQQKAEHRAAQRKGTVIAEFMDEHPELTREHAEEVYAKVIQGIGL